MMIETDWIKQVIRDYWKTILSANIKPSDPCHLNMSAKSFFINIGLWLFPQIKLNKFCPSIPIKFYSTSRHSVTKWGWLVQRSCFGQLAIPRTILEISLVSLLGKRCFSSTRNSLSLTILLHEHACPIRDFLWFFGQSWLDVLNFKLIFFGYFTFSSGLVFSAKLYQVAEIVVKHLR